MGKSQNKTLRALERCNYQIGDLISKMEEVDEDLLHEKPAAEIWSVIQIFMHLLEAEEFVLSYMNYKLRENAVFRKETLKSKVYFSLMMIVYSFPIKLKAPKSLKKPGNELQLEEIKARFLKFRLELQQFIENQDESFFNYATCKHPVVGRITLVKMLRFFHKHTAHHEKQMLRRLIQLSS